MTDSNARRLLRDRTVFALGVVLFVTIGLSVPVLTTPVGERTHQPTGRQSACNQSILDRSTRQQTTPNQSASAFDGSVFRDVAGQVATEDGIVTVRGTATGTDHVLVTLFDRRGRVATELLSVNDDVFEEEDLELVTADGTSLGEGLVVATVLSPGRDGVVGDGELPGVSRAGLADFEEYVRNTSRPFVGNRTISRTQRQVVELFYDQTVDDAGSDDLLLAEEFVYTNGRTTIEGVFPESQSYLSGTVEPIHAGDAMVVCGVTNRKPDDNTIFVEVVEGPSAETLDLAATDAWQTDGVWSVTIEVPRDTEPGTYTILADDGDDTDTFQVEIRPAGGTATASEPASWSSPGCSRTWRDGDRRRGGRTPHPSSASSLDSGIQPDASRSASVRSLCVRNRLELSA